MTTTTNPLVVAPMDTSSPLGGTMLLESLADLSQALESGSWLEVGLAAFSTAMDTVAAVMDPLGQLIAAGLGWLMEHMEPLKGWLNDLTGDAGAVAAFGATWDNIKAALEGAAEELDRLVKADFAGMTGAAVVAYGRYAGDFGSHVRAVSGAAGAVAAALRICSTVVQVVHDLVRDALAELVGAAISWAAEIVFTLGLGTPWVVSQVATRVSSLATRVGTKVTEVVTSVRSLKNLVEAIKEALSSLARTLRGAKPGSTHTPDVPPTRGAATPPTPTPPHAPGKWPPDPPSGPKPKPGEDGADVWRYERYLYGKGKNGADPDDCLSFDEWREKYYEPVVNGDRPGRRGGAEQVAAKEQLATEGIREVENVELGGRYPDGIAESPNAAGGSDYYEVGTMLKKGIPEARERIKLQEEIDALGPNDTITFVSKTDPTHRITYRPGDKVE